MSGVCVSSVLRPFIVVGLFVGLSMTMGWRLAAAQPIGGTVNGVVTDESGAVVMGAWLTLADVATGVQRTATANEQGAYTFVGLPSGRYTLTAGHEGFAPLHVTDIVVVDGEQRVVPVMLKISPLTEAVSIEGASGSYTTSVTGAATRMPLSLRETPQSVSVIGQQQIEDQNLRTLDDVLRQTPGIVVQRRDERVNYFSRGFTLNQMVDGVPTLAYTSVAAEASMNSMAIYDRVEVIRGPAGLLNGVGQPGGSINLVRKRPTAELSGSVSVGVDSWNRYLAQADVGGPLNAAKTLRGRLVVSHTAGDSFIDNKSRRDEVLYGVVEADLTSSTTLAAGLEYQKTPIEGANFGAAPPFYNNHTSTSLPRSFSSSTSWSIWDMETKRLFLNLEHRVSDGWRLKADASYLNNQRERYSGDIWLDPANIDPVTHIGVVQLGDNPANGTNKTLDVYASGPFGLLGRTHQAVVGLNINRYSYETRTNKAIDTGTMIDQRSVDIFNLDVIAKPDFKYPRYYFGADTEEEAIYASTQLRATDALSFLIGGRVSWYENDPWTRRWFSGGDGAKVQGVPIEESAVFTPYAGIVYDVSKELSVYASYTDIFQPNTLNDSSGNVLDPQRGTNVELGVKGEHFGGALNTSFAVFRTEQDNVPVASGFQPDGSVAYVAVKGTKSRGVELTVAGELTRGWQVMGGYSDVAPRNRDGSLLSPNLPTRLFTVATSYRLPGKWSKATLGADMKVQNGTTLMDPYGLGVTSQGNVTLLGLMARYDISRRLSISLNLENVTDRHYVSYGATGYVYGSPRNAWLKATYGF